MTPIIVFSLFLASAIPDPPWQDLALTIFSDPGVSSDVSTLCRVRVDNRGSHTWSGRRLTFEAEALEGDRPVERARAAGSA